MAILEEFLSNLPNEQLKLLCETLRKEIMLFDKVAIQKKFNLPFFYGKTWICYFNLVKKTTGPELELCFVRARELPSKELLNFKERVMVAGLSYRNVADIDYGVLKLLLEEAITLDDETPYTFTKKKK